MDWIKNWIQKEEKVLKNAISASGNIGSSKNMDI